MQAQALRVTRLELTNFKRISAVDIRPGNRTLIILRGPNEAGKTSTVDGMIATLAGKGASPEVPVRRGEEAAAGAVTLADSDGDRYYVTRSWKADRTYLNVVKYGPDGQPEKVAQPQTHLDDLLSDLTFDPLALAKTKDPREQARLLFAAAGKSAEFEAAQARRKHLYEVRRQRNADCDALRRITETHPDPAPGHDLKETTDEQFAAQLEQARQHNAGLAGFEGVIEAAAKSEAARTTEIEEAKAQIAEIERHIAAATGLITDARAAAAKAREQLAEAGQPIDTNTIVAQINHVQKANEAARLQAHHRKALDQLRVADANASGADEDLRDLDRQLAQTLAATDLGTAVPGLAFDGQQITHNQLPFSQASGMRRLELSTLVGMAANKPLHTMAIDEGDQLDDASLKRLHELALERDYQLWMTAIRAGDETDPDTLIVPVLDGQALGAAGVPAVIGTPGFALGKLGIPPPALAAAGTHMDDL